MGCGGAARSEPPCLAPSCPRIFATESPSGQDAGPLRTCTNPESAPAASGYQQVQRATDVVDSPTRLSCDGRALPQAVFRLDLPRSYSFGINTSGSPNHG